MRRPAVRQALPNLQEAGMTELRPAAEGELAVIRLLLEQAGLPTSDLAADISWHNVVARAKMGIMRIMGASAIPGRIFR